MMWRELVARWWQRRRGDRGSAMVLSLVLMFAFTAGGVVWLSHDVGIRISNQSAAQSVAFQAARAGAQQLATDDLRGGGAVVVLDTDAARVAAQQAAGDLLAAYGLDGSAAVVVETAPPKVTVTVTITSSGGSADGVGSAYPERTG